MLGADLIRSSVQMGLAAVDPRDQTLGIVNCANHGATAMEARVHTGPVDNLPDPSVGQHERIVCDALPYLRLHGKRATGTFKAKCQMIDHVVGCWDGAKVEI